MNKKITSSELINKIENNELKVGHKIKFTIAPEEKVVEITRKDEGLYMVDIETGNVINTGWLINSNVEILDEPEEIEELEVGDTLNYKRTRNKINELVRAVNQMRKERE